MIKNENVELFQGDCMKIMPKISDNSIDMVRCDLPFGITSLTWDSTLSFTDLWYQYNRIVKDGGIVALFSAGDFTIDLIMSNRKQFKYKLIWKKNVPTGMSSAKYRPMKYYEEICIFQIGKGNSTYNPILKPRVGQHKECYRYEHYCSDNNHIQLKKIKKRYEPNWVQPSDVLEFDVVPNRNGKLHPTQKPVELLEWLIKTYSNEGQVILDNCCGSCSTGIACLNTKRKFIGIELDEQYFHVAERRMEDQLN